MCMLVLNLTLPTAVKHTSALATSLQPPTDIACCCRCDYTVGTSLSVVNLIFISTSSLVVSTLAFVLDQESLVDPRVDEEC